MQRSLNSKKRLSSFYIFDSLILKFLLISYPIANVFQVQPQVQPSFLYECKEKVIAVLFKSASWLTDPLCTAHQLYLQARVIDALYPNESQIKKGMRKSGLWLSASAHTVVALATTLPAIEFRLLAIALQDRPFLHKRGDAEEKVFSENKFSLLSWNLCCLTGGLSITEGGVLPWLFRKEELVSAIKAQDADVVCLYEIFDIQTAHTLIQGLKENYSHFYYHIGPSVIGFSSGLFVAAKGDVGSPEFIPFPEDALWGRSRHLQKGVFSFDLKKHGKTWAKIFSTHFQHSERPGQPQLGEIRARDKEMELILERMQATEHLCVLTGDLNLAEAELNASPWHDIFDQGLVEGEGCTWCGDAFCASLVGKMPSPPANLDHTMVKKGCECVIKTRYVETGFEPTSLKKEALSDHKGLLSIITLPAH